MRLKPSGFWKKQVEQADPSAADELWERHRPALRRMDRTLRLDQALGRRVDAGDIVQDVLLRASQRLGRSYVTRPCRFISGFGRSLVTT